MKTIAALLALPVLAAAQAIINTPPSLVQCQPVAITYSGGTAPYFISVLPGGQQSAAPLKVFPTQNDQGSYTWEKVDLPAGTTITLQIRDGSGRLNFSDQVTIQPGIDDDCLNGAVSVLPPAGSDSSSSAASSSSSAASSSTTRVPGTTTTATGTTTGSSSTTTAVPTASGSSSSSTTLPPSASPTGAAMGRMEAGVGLALAAFVAAVVAA